MRERLPTAPRAERASRPPGPPARGPTGASGPEPGRAAPTSAAAYRRLRLFNLAVGLVLAAQAVVVVLAGNGLSLPVTASYLRSDPNLAQGPAASSVVFRVGIGPAVAAFLLLAAADHLAVASPALHRWYERRLAARDNYARWVEYTISASIMVVLIVMFAGIRDIAALLAIFGVNSSMILFGLLMERGQRPGAADADWSAFAFGTFAGLVPWIALAVYVAGAPSVPGFVYAIIATQFVLFASFAANMVLQYRQVGRWRSYLYGESGYIVLSLCAKSLLAWLVFANVLRS